MAESSGRQLSAEATIRQGRIRRSRASLISGGSEVATIESRWRPTEIADANKARNTTVRFPDGAAWRIVTGPPDREPDSRRTVFGRIKPGNHFATDRVVTVYDERNRVVAWATWQQSKPGENEPGDAAWREAKDTASSALKRASAEVRRPRSHRRGRGRLLLGAVGLLWLAVGSLPAAIVGITTGAPGLAIAFGIVFVISLTFGIRLMRQWQDPSRCWSCGRDITGRPDLCPFCSAAKPHTAGLGPRFLGTSGLRDSAGKVVAGSAEKVFGTSGAPFALIVASGVSYPLAEDVDQTWTSAEHRLGDALVLTTRWTEATFAPSRPIPLEAALLAWHIASGDLRIPSAD
jgi:hypothetical protein